jgi:hypothetical protein
VPILFDTEIELVDEAMKLLGSGRSPWGTVELVTEWDYRHGRADILARTANNSLIALEAKLTRWQVACDQAYRSTAYASQAYVLLPEQIAAKALRNCQRFEHRRIGLCTITKAGILMLIEAPVVSPLMHWITDLAHSTFDGLKDASTKSRTRRTARLCSA